MFSIRYVCALLLAISSITTYAHSGVAIDKVIAFGDSLSDNGNFYSYSLHFVPKNPPYYEGRFSNGPTWVEQLTEGLTLDPNSKDGLIDCAYGGATARPDKNDIAWQVNNYFKHYANDMNIDKHLFVVWIGGNDYLPGTGSTDQLTTEAVASIQKHINILIQHGAKNILTFNLPDLGRTPLAELAGPQYAAKVSHMIQLHNAKLNFMLAKMRLQHPDVRIIFFDVTSVFNDALSHPQKYGIKYTHDACFNGDTFMFSALKDPKYDAVKERLKYGNLIVFCRNADDFFFFDHVHPTRVVHEMIAERVLKKLKQNGIGD